MTACLHCDEENHTDGEDIPFGYCGQECYDMSLPAETSDMSALVGGACTCLYKVNMYTGDILVCAGGTWDYLSCFPRDVLSGGLKWAIAAQEGEWTYIVTEEPSDHDPAYIYPLPCECTLCDDMYGPVV